MDILKTLKYLIYKNLNSLIATNSNRKIIPVLFLVACFIENTAFTQNNVWPGFHGADRKNKSAETGLINHWPENGPSLLWTASGLGEGFCSTTIGDGMIFTAGKDKDQTYVFAFDFEGKTIWKKASGEPWKVTVSWASSYNGPRSSPTYDNGFVYHLSENGKLTAFSSRNGDIIWTRDLPKDFSAEIPTYGYTQSVITDGDNLYVRPAGKKGFEVCLNKRTGATLWTNTEIPGSYGYNSMIIKDFGGYRQVIGGSSNCFYGLDAGTGKLLWKFDFSNERGLNCTDAVTNNEYIFLTSGYGKGCTLIRLKSDGTGISAAKVWESELLDNHHGGVILDKGYIYGSGSNARGWFCLDFMTGKQMWKTDGKGSLTFADGMLYLYDEKGNIKLVKATPDKFEKSGEFKTPKGGEGPYWSHPVVCNGRLYLRHADKLFVYNIKN